jgi:hypothetical protein
MSADDLPSVWLDPPPAIESDWLGLVPATTSSSSELG